MAELIHHHYDSSPYAEKIRMVFGLKRLTWRSVIVPSTMPKPDLMPLTGGYRRTPVFQIGADIYCDTQLIAEVLEQLYPTPTLFPDGNPGLQMALGHWANGSYVVTSVALRMGGEEPIPENLGLPANLIEDRKKMWMTQFDTDLLGPKLDVLRSQLDAFTGLIDQQLEDGRSFLTGDVVSWVDICLMWNPWFLFRFCPLEAERAYGKRTRIINWLNRLENLGQGTRVEMEPSEALDIAKNSEPKATEGLAPGDPIGLKIGDATRISPSDYAEADILGKLVGTTASSITIARDDPRVGTVHVHFPKIGYSIEKV